MILPEQQAYIQAHAYVPEHLPAYVTAITGAEPFLTGDWVVYAGEDRLVFVGYPLQEPFSTDRLARAVDEAIDRFRPSVVSVMAPAVPSSLAGGKQLPVDNYYRLDLAGLSIPQKVRNMLARAGREVSVIQGEKAGPEHRRLIKDFLHHHPLDENSRFIFSRIPEYVTAPTAQIFEARNRHGELVAFDVAEFGAQQYAFYMFNFRAYSRYVPGASDLLLHAIIRQAAAKGKRYLNLGLGINAGVTFFKTKWGGKPFLPYTTCLYRPSPAWTDLLNGLLG